MQTDTDWGALGEPTIDFTQYIPPHGRRKEVVLPVKPEVAAKAADIITAGLCFECEVLSTGQVSFTITDPKEGDLDIVVVPNGPGTREAVEAMVLRFDMTGGAA